MVSKFVNLYNLCNVKHEKVTEYVKLIGVL